ncbi:MAG: helix-turn-helix transcriptional regulator [Candidatus Delongbacteria bacterium]|nr:helix-turn-helix transcriptional regulator [Candidatus Delongbacteria bacterium]
MDKIGKLIRERRKILGINQKDLSEISGVTQHSISNIETGIGNPTLETLTKLCHVLGLKLNIEIRDVE